MSKKYNVTDYIGKKFGKRTVLYGLGVNNCGHTIVRCRCECGKEDDVELCLLLHGRSGGCHSCSNTEYRKRKTESITSSQQHFEKPTNRNKSGYVGVFKNNRTNRWVSQVKVHRKTYYLGAYTTQKEALSVVNGFIIANKLSQHTYKIQKYHGEIESIEKE